MANSIYDKLMQALKQAENHNSHIMVRPEVILWPDPESQWMDVIEVLQANLPQLLVLGNYDPQKKQGPTLWIKCMVARVLPDAQWGDEVIPIIYLPGVAKSDIRNVEAAVFNFQPIIEYQYTGAIFQQENGREWSIQAFVENPIQGLGVKVAQDNATKLALKKTLPSTFQDPDVFLNRALIDADYLNSQLFPDIHPSILKWMCKGDRYLETMDKSKREAFADLCKSRFNFEPDQRNIKAIAEMLGSQKNDWAQVWQLYASAPHKYPEIENLLRLAKPDDLGMGLLFGVPRESWPQVNEEMEAALESALNKATKLAAAKALDALIKLDQEHSVRRSWVWSDLGKTPLADALEHLVVMARRIQASYASNTVDDLKYYYLSEGYVIDQSMRLAYAAVRTDKDKGIVSGIIQLIYQPWLENLAVKFQKCVAHDSGIFHSQQAIKETEPFILFVDALRYELAVELLGWLEKRQWRVSLDASWSAIPSLTPTAKPSVSPIAPLVSTESTMDEFRPRLQSGKDLQTAAFRDELQEVGYTFVSNATDIGSGGNYWQEIGSIDTRGHEEQANMVRRIDELFEQIIEALEVAFDKGIKRIKIVTDHGWLLLPGGLPKTQLHAGLTETRWGRCALIKEGAVSDLMYLPWRWNPSVYIAYAPGISFFKANVEYAHGGISLQECLVPTMIIDKLSSNLENTKIKEVKWVNLKCTVYASESNDDLSVDIRTKFSDPITSVVLSINRKMHNGMVTLMIDDAVEQQAVIVVLIDQHERILDKIPTTVGG